MKKIHIFLGVSAMAFAAVVWSWNPWTKDQKGGEGQQKPDEFVIAQGRFQTPVTPAELEVLVSEATVTSLEPVVIDRGTYEASLTLFETPTPKKPKVMGMGFPVPEKENQSPVNEAKQDGKEPEQGAYLGPTAGLRFSFDSTVFDDNVTTTGSVFIPPDSHGAAGPSHLVNVVNTTIRFHAKDGTLQFQDSLANFFAALTPLTNTFDPKVIYDQYANRFVVVTLEQTDTFVGAPANTSRILLAVSDDNNPNGTWYTTSINASTLIGGTPHWADYPGFGVDSSAIYITANMFSFFSFGGTFGGNRLWSVAKDLGTGFYAGGPTTATVIDPVPGGGFGLTQQPSHTFGSAPFSGTYLAGFSGLSNGVDEFFQVIRVEDPLTAPLLDLQFVNFGNVDALAGALPKAPQLGSAVRIDTNDRRTFNAVYREDFLYVTTHVNPRPGLPDAGQTTAVFGKLDASNLAAVAVDDLVLLGGEDIAPQTTTFFPSVAVNRNGDVAVGFSASASTIYASSYFTTRLCTDLPGSFGPSTLLRAGQDFYVRTFGNSNRWGDYSSVAVDPLSNTFWVYNEHALPRGLPTSPPLEDGRWGTAYGLTAPCVQTRSLPQGQWVFISLPCEARGATVANSFGDDLAGVYGVDWSVVGFNQSTQSRYVLGINDRLSSGIGYFVRTSLPNQSVTVGDISNTKYGFKLAVRPGQLTLNFKGQPYPITTCWANVLVIDGANLLTLSQADPLIGGVRACDMVPPDPSCVMSRVAMTYNGTSFDSIDGITPGMQGTLDPWEGILIRAFKPGIGIRFPSVPDSGCGGPVAGSFEIDMQDPQLAMQQGWYARILADSDSGSDYGAVFGQLPESTDGRDASDLVDFAPEDEVSLNVSFSVSNSTRTSERFSSDYRALDGLNAKDSWQFQVQSIVGESVSLQIEAPAWLLAQAVLTDTETGLRIPAHQIHTYQAKQPVRTFRIGFK